MHYGIGCIHQKLGDYEEWPAVVAQLADESEGPRVLMALSAGGMTAVSAAAAAAAT
jgi:hypothetical protein